MVQQYYDTDVNKEYVIRGNAGVLKCQVPSFVADFVHVVSWHTEHDETFVMDNNYGNSSSRALYSSLSFSQTQHTKGGVN